MSDLYPGIEPHSHGNLDVGDGHHIHWETCGTAAGKPALVLHGGPGSGCTPWHRRLFDPTAYRVVLFDQRGCSRSIPHASTSAADLSANTTPHLLTDIEALRVHLGIDRWLLLGGSWGSTLSLAYAVTHPERVTEIVLFGVTTGRRSEFDWTFRGGLARFFPEQWDRLLTALPDTDRDSDVVDAYHRLLFDLDPAVQRRAAEAWCLWESATPAWPPAAGLAARFRDPDYALAFARIVTHYVRHNGWLPEQGVLPLASRLHGIPGVLINGRWDFQAPMENAWELARAWPDANLVIVDDAGHTPGARLAEELVRATDRSRAKA